MGRLANRGVGLALVLAVVGACGSRPPPLTEQPAPQPATRILLSALTQVLEYDLATGAFRRIFASGFTHAFGIAPGPDGRIYVADFTARTIVRLDAQSGASLGVFASPSCDPYEVQFGPGGDLFVGCSGGAVQRFHGTTGAALGTFVATPGTGYDMGGMTFRDGSLFVSYVHSPNGSVMRYDAATGAPQGTVHAGFSSNGPRRAAFGPDGAMYVPDWQTPTVRKFAPSTLTDLGNIVNDGFAVPMNVAFTPGGELLVLSDPCCDGPDTIRRYNPTNGTFLGVLVAAGSGGLTRASAMVLVP